LCFGQAVSRSDYASLFTAIGTTYGSGDGSTTFTLPDMRGRVAAGKDDMGGSTAGRITSGNSGITGTTLSAAGGDERLHQHTHTFTGSAVTSGAGSAHAHANTLTNNAVTSGNDNAEHTHTYSGTVVAETQDHTHGLAFTTGAGGGFNLPQQLNGVQLSYGGATGGRSATHNHTYSGTTNGRSAVHQHSVTSNVTISNVNESAHTHSVTASGTNANSGAGGAQNVQPTIILNYIIKAVAF
jgi:microcystin-dependent protein